MSRLSLCLIACNAERDLERCLVSVQGVVDEVVVVDTGSTDDTRTIALAYAQRFAEFTWQDDFASARNFSLSLATGDWILVLDADEELDPATRDLIRPALELEDVAAYQLLMNNLVSGALPLRTQFQFRLFRNLPTIRYANLIHEQIVESLSEHMARTGQRALQLPAQIVHYGYLEGYNPDRAQRNQRMLRKALLKSPQDPYFLYKLARELRMSDPEESRDLQSRAARELLTYPAERLASQAFAIEVLANEIQDRATRADDSAALLLCDEVIRCVLPHPLIHYLRGVLNWRLGNLEASRADLEYSLSLEPAGSTFYYDAQEIQWRSNAMLGELYFRAGFFNRAELCFTEVLNTNPEHSSSRAYQLRLKALGGDAVGALRTCVEWVQQTGEAEASLLCAELLHALGRYETARTWLARVNEDYQDRPDVQVRAAQLKAMLDLEPSQ